jgi:hypothetical protein
MRWSIMGAAVLVGLLLAALFAGRPWLESMLRKKMLAFVESHFESRAQLQRVSLSLVPRVAISGEGFVLRYHGRTDLPPFISIRRFSADIGPIGLLRGHIHHVRLEGLEIHVPPHEEREQYQHPKQAQEEGSRSDVVVDELIADGTLLDMIPRQADKPHHVFHLYKLSIHDASASQPMRFHSALSNPKPPGLILTDGEFGPWNKDDPAQTPVSGAFHFEHADLGVFHSIAGILSSKGSYKGVLERIEVDGHTDTPDFMVQAAGHRVHLRTQYHSIVDGTNGDTVLDPVIADFLHSRIIARGAVTQTDGSHGRTVVLDVTGDHTRMEDLLALGVKSQPSPMSGAVQLQTKFRLPPGHKSVIDKLLLDGRVSVQSGHFASPTVQQKVDTLSEKARGKPKKEEQTNQVDDDVLSNLQVRYRLQNGELRVSQAAFEVPGAHVTLHGTCAMDSRALDFRGTLRLQAKLSQTTTGVKSILLKLADPFFKKKDAGAVVPIKVGGTLRHPSFGLNLGGSK